VDQVTKDMKFKSHNKYVCVTVYQSNDLK